MQALLKKNLYVIILSLSILCYILYFSYFTILRYHTLWAHYFDLGIMHQTVYNSYRALAEQDWGRFLELTNPYGPQQIKRMAIHNDLLLGGLALFYFIYAGPETLLVIQSIALGLGALAVYDIAAHIFKQSKYCRLFSLVLSLSYLLYTPMQRANIFDFHAVVLATPLLLFMFYYWLKKRYLWSLVFFAASILTKEEVPLTTAAYAILVFAQIYKKSWKVETLKKYWYPLTILASSAIWFCLSLLVIIPTARGGGHFALSYYGDFGDSPKTVLLGIFKNPLSLVKYILHIDTARYFFFLLGPLGFLSLLAPQYLLIALPEFAINLLSNNWNMRNIIYHYTAVIQPFVFISAAYGACYALRWLTHKYGERRAVYGLVIWLTVSALFFSVLKSPLPYSTESDLAPLNNPKAEANDAFTWRTLLQEENLKIAATGKLGPLFASRRYYYHFSPNYRLADYVIIYVNEIYNDFQTDQIAPVYEDLRKNPDYELIYKKDELEVYKRKAGSVKGKA